MTQFENNKCGTYFIKFYKVFSPVPPRCFGVPGNRLPFLIVSPSLTLTLQSSVSFFMCLGSFNENLRPPELLFRIIFWLGYFNSCLNPIIYPCYSREFKMAFIRILRCQCHQQKRPSWRAYNYSSSNFSSSGNSRKSSTDHTPSWMNGSQRTLPSSASPSPSYLSSGLPPCPEGETLYIWGANTPTPSTPNLLLGSPADCQQVVLRGEVRGDKAAKDPAGGVFSFSFENSKDKEGRSKDGIINDDKV